MKQLEYKAPSFVEAYKMAFSNCTNFEDRSRRAEFWKFTAVYDLIQIILFVIGVTLGSNGMKPDAVMAFLFGGVWLVHLLPSLSVFARRLHDVGHTSKWIIATLIPLIGGIVAIVLLLWLFCDSTKEDNEWGESPKYYTEE